MTGIYSIRNLINNKRYIGQALDIDARLGMHVYLLNHNSDSSYLQNSWNKYGRENFVFEILEECSIDDLNDKEIYWIKEYSTFVGFENSNGYNLTKGGEGCKGYTHTEKTRRLLSENHADFKGSKNPHYGIKTNYWTEESKRKVSERMSGSNNPMYGRSRSGKLHPMYGKGYLIEGENNPNYGNPSNWHPSEDTIKKMSSSKKGTSLMNNGKKCKYVKKEDIESYLLNGWTLGRVKKMIIKR